MEENRIPKNWTISNIENCIEILDNKRKPVSAKERAKRLGNIPYYGATGIAGYIDDFIFNDELVLLGEDGAPFLDKGKNVAYLIKGKSWVNNHAHVLKAKNNITTNRFVLYFLNQFEYEGFVGGTTRLKLNQGNLKRIPFVLPPRPEQDRIVAKVDVLMAQVATMQKSLERIPQLLKDFRQQVLTQAVTGKLNLNIGRNDSVLMLRAVSIEHFVKSLKKDIRTGPFGSALKKEEHQLDGIPVWGIESIGKEGKFTGKNKIFVTVEKAKQLKSFEVKGGDVIISRSGTVGELCVLPEDVPFGLISTNLMKIVLNKDIIIPKFFCWSIKADPRILNRLEELCKGSTRLFLTQTILQKLEFKIPTIKEQQKIVGYVDHLFIKADVIETQYQNLKAKIDSLPQAILHKAFKGELVEQLPTDGDAKDLLREIEKLKTKPKNAKVHC